MKITPIVVYGFAVLLLAASSAASAQSTSGTMATPAKTMTDKRIEQRIKRLHDRLKITASEEQLWAEVADSMRSSAQTVGALIRERSEKAKSMNAVDDLRAYQAIAEAHAAGTAKLVPAFQALYAAMPPEQQKIADAVFAASTHRRAVKKEEK